MSPAWFFRLFEIAALFSNLFLIEKSAEIMKSPISVDRIFFPHLVILKDFHMHLRRTFLDIFCNNWRWDNQTLIGSLFLIAKVSRAISFKHMTLLTLLFLYHFAYVILVIFSELGLFVSFWLSYLDNEFY